MTTNSEKINNVTFLPSYFRTDTNKKFIQSTIDQLVQPGTVKKINGYIGQQNSQSSTGSDIFIESIDQKRQNYQLEPALLIDDSTGTNKFFKDYHDFINQLKIFGSNTSHYERLNTQEFYSWDPHICWDKFVNFQQYYWLPNGPPVIKVSANSANIVSEYNITIDSNSDSAYIFSENSSLGLVKNPAIRLYRGNTYKFNINSLGNPLSIKTQRATGNAFRYSGLDLKGYAVELGIIELTITEDTPEILFYQSENNIDLGGIFQIFSVDENSIIDVELELLGKKNYQLANGIKLSNGMKLEFQGQVVPQQYSQGYFYVEGVGTAIKLISEKELNLTANYISEESSLFDNTLFDAELFNDTNRNTVNFDYITINRASQDRNYWSRYNRWFHEDVIKTSATINNRIINLDQNSRATRPIIEFEADLKLFNFGSWSVGDVDVIDKYTTNIYAGIEGSSGYAVDGVKLAENQKILFINESNADLNNKIYQVNFVDLLSDGTRQIHLTLLLEPEIDSTVLIKNGVENRGLMYWFNGINWLLCQQKNIINQPPLFDVVDGNQISFNDPMVYPSSTFSGTKLFSYKIGTGVSDSKLGFPLTYKNINNVGDIVFNFDFEKDLFQYNFDNQSITYNINQGFLIRSTFYGGKTFVNGWQKNNVNNVKTTKAAIRIYHGSQQINNFDLDIFNDINALDDLIVEVYGNNEKLNPSNWSIINNGLYKRIVLINDIGNNDIITIKAHTSQPINSNGYYEDSWKIDTFNVVQPAIRIFKNANVIPVTQLVPGDTYSVFTLGTTDYSIFSAIENTIGFKFIATGPLIGTGTVLRYTFDLDHYTDIENLQDLNVSVYVNDTKLTTDQWSIKNSALHKKITINVDISETSIITLETFSKQRINDLAYYEIPLNLQHNPLNQTIDNFTLGEVIDHVATIIDNVQHTTNNYSNNIKLKDLGNITQYGTKFVQHSCPASLSYYHITSETNNIIKAIEQSRDDYGKFKRNFVDTAENINISTDIISQVNSILYEINKNKLPTNQYFFSDMVAYGAYTKNDFTVIDHRIKTYPLSQPFTLEQLSNKAVYIYLNEQQLVYQVDYLFNNESFVVINDGVDLNDRDIISIYEYDSTDGSFIPETPTKLGIWPKYTPKLYLDTTLLVPRMMIQGHDGSLTLAYGDYRDSLILELERRIYNNIKVEYNPDIFNISDIIPSYNRNTAYSLSEFNNTLASSFYKWLPLVDKDFTKVLNYDRANSFTYNYVGHTVPDGRTAPGFWRGIYSWLLDTDRPQICPWEMLGFTQEPDWWVSIYGAAPYTSDNLILWSDVSAGIIREPDNIRQNNRYKKPFLTRYALPVDSLGNLISPASSSLAKGTITVSTQSDFTFGDQSPVENTWRRSSYYPFSILIAGILLCPSKIFGTVFDRSRQIKNIAGQLVYQATGLRITTNSIKLPSLYNTTSRCQTAGLVNYVVNYSIRSYANSYNEYQYDLKNLRCLLSYRVSGFTSKEKFNLLLDSKSPISNQSVFIPKEDYSLLLNTSNPIKKVVYSGIIITKVQGGFDIKGYSKTNPFFKYYKPLYNTGKTINVGGISENFVQWSENQYYLGGKIVSYSGRYYRIKVSHTSESTFDNSLYTILPELPIVGGRTVIIKSSWDRSTEITAPYGTKLIDVQTVVDFIIGYGEYLKDQGFIFDEFSTEFNQILNWETSVREFLFWTTQNWSSGQDKWLEWNPGLSVKFGTIVQYGGEFYKSIISNNNQVFDEEDYIRLDSLSTLGSSVISLSPAAYKLSFNVSLSVIENINSQFNEYEIFSVNGAPIPTKDIKSFKDGNTVTYTIKGENGIYGASFYLTQKEHVVTINNETIFNDTIYHPATGYKQNRVKVSGYVSTDWDGSFNVPGFVFDQAIVNEWGQWRDYALGDIVKYKEFHYAAKYFIPGTAEFNFNDWHILQNKPQAQLLPNWTYKATQFNDFYNLDSNNFDVQQQKIAQHLIGYQKRQYLENIIKDDVSEFKFYQGMIADKGTKNVFDKLFGALTADLQESMNFHEEWAIRVGQYGACSAFETVEFILDQSKFKNNPQGFELVNQKDSTEFDFIIKQVPDELYIKPIDYKSSPWPVVTSFKQFLRPAGYIKPQDANYVFRNTDDLLTQSVKPFCEGDYIWTTFQGNDWGIYRITKINLDVKSITYNDSTLSVMGNRLSTSVAAGDIIGILNFQGSTNFLKVTSVSSSKILINAKLSNFPNPNIYGGGYSINGVALSSPGEYTSIPKIQIKAPSRPNGVAARAIVESMQIIAATITSGGTGYMPNDKLFISTQSGSATLIVSAVTTTNQVVAVNLSASDRGKFKGTLVTNAVTTTSNGLGTGCQLSLKFGVNQILVTNPGFGYWSQNEAKITFDNGVEKIVTLAVIATNSTGNIFTVSSTGTIKLNMPVQFFIDIGGVSPNQVYYVSRVVDSTTFTISDTVDGPVFPVYTDNRTATAHLYSSYITASANAILSIPEDDVLSKLIFLKVSNYRTDSIDNADTVFSKKFKTNEMLWTDNAGDNKWAAWVHKPVYKSTQLAPSSPYDTVNFGELLAINLDNSVLAVMHESNIIKIYNKNASQTYWKFLQNISTPFISNDQNLLNQKINSIALSPNGTWLAIGIPWASNVTSYLKFNDDNSNTWKNSVEYLIGDIIEYESNYYQATVGNLGKTPNINQYFYQDLADVNGAVFDVTYNNYAYHVTMTEPGVQYAVGNDIVIPGTLLGGSAANNLIIHITSIIAHSNQAELIIASSIEVNNNIAIITFSVQDQIPFIPTQKVKITNLIINNIVFDGMYEVLESAINFITVAMPELNAAPMQTTIFEIRLFGAIGTFDVVGSPVKYWTEIPYVPVSQYGTNSPLVEQGAVAIYQRINESYVHINTIISKNNIDHQHFGYSLKFNDHALYASAPCIGVTQPNRGRVYAFKYSEVISASAEYRPQNSYDNILAVSSVVDISAGMNVLVEGLNDLIVISVDSQTNTLTLSNNVTTEPYGILNFGQKEWVLDKVITSFSYENYNLLPYENSSNQTTNDYNFGRLIDVSRDNSIVLISTSRLNSFPGKTYVYKDLQGYDLNSFDNSYDRYNIDSPQIIPNTTLVDQQFAISGDGQFIAVSDSVYDTKNYIDEGKVDLYQLQNNTYVHYQTIKNFKAEQRQYFGSKLAFVNGNKTLVIYSKSADTFIDLILDNKSTTFDRNLTTFTDPRIDSGRIDIYDQYATKWVFSESLETNNFNLDNYGRGFTVSNTDIIVSAPAATYKDFACGLVYEYRKNKNAYSWTIKYREIDKIDLSKIKKAFIYNRQSNSLLSYIDIIDPIQGKICGVAEQELTYKTFFDPAIYSRGSSDVTVDAESAWTTKQVGLLWWDLRTIKFIDCYNDDVIYRNNTWNTIAPGSSIDVYEWVASTVTPSIWNSLSATNEGFTQGISGQSLYDDSVYSVSYQYDKISKSFKNIYYFWVKNKAILPQIKGRKTSALDVAGLISNPRGRGYKFLALTGSNSFVLTNVDNLLEDTHVLLSVDYWTVDNIEQNIHSQWKLISNSESSSIPKVIEQKLVDSLAGKDLRGRLVPSLNLPEKLKYGIENRPQQSMFVNRFEALKQIFEQVNLVFNTYPIARLRDISALSVYDIAPKVKSGLYDQVIDFADELIYINTNVFSTALLHAEILDGKIVGIIIDHAGDGYVNAPSIEIIGSGRDANIKSVIENGKIIGYNILSSGAGYTSNTVCQVRDYSVLVEIDSEINSWSIHSFSQFTKRWERIQCATFDIRRYWTYADWYEQGYNQFNSADYAIDTLADISATVAEIGDLIKVKTTNQGNWLLLEKFNNSTDIDWTKNYKIVGEQNGTIQFTSSLYDYANAGFSATFYDNVIYDSVSSTEVHYIFDALKNSVFIDDFKNEYLNLFFTGVRYAHSEQIYLDWVFKTSFIKVKHNIGELGQGIAYKNSNLENFEDFINEVKPYRTQVREYLSGYTKLEPADISVTDFDLPPFVENQKSRTINTKVIDGNIIADHNNIELSPWSQWRDNLGFEVLEIKLLSSADDYSVAPTVSFMGECKEAATAKVHIANGRISKISLLTHGSGYLTAPEIVFDPPNDLSRAIAIIGNSVIRSNLVNIKFDRIAKNIEFFQIQETESGTTNAALVGTGYHSQFALTWSPDARTGTSSVTVDGVDIIRSRYKLSTTKSVANNQTVYSGLITFDYLLPKGAIIDITYNKNWNILSATDRIQYYYNPIIGQPGKDFSQLMSGVDYGGVIVYGLGFDQSRGWDSLPYQVEYWDTLNAESQEFTVSADYSTQYVQLPYIPAKDTEINVYFVKKVSVQYLVSDNLTYDYNSELSNPIVTTRRSVPTLESQNNIFGSFILSLISTKNVAVGDIITTDVDDLISYNTEVIRIVDEYTVELDQHIKAIIPTNTNIVFSSQLRNGVDYKLYLNGKLTLTKSIATDYSTDVSITIAGSLAPVKIDDVDYDSGTYSNTNAIMATYKANGIDNIVNIPAAEPYGDVWYDYNSYDKNQLLIESGDQFILKISTQDSSDTSVDYDTVLSGGSLTYDTASGLLADDILVDGDDFVSPTNSAAPEELIPGNVVDTVAIKVFDNLVVNSANIKVDRHFTDGVTTSFKINQVINNQAVIVKLLSSGMIGTILEQTADYTVNLSTNTVEFTVAPLADQVIVIYSLGVTGTNLLDFGYFISNGVDVEYLTRVSWFDLTTLYVTVDGHAVEATLFNTDGTYEQENLIGIRLDQIPAQGSVIHYIIAKGTQQSFAITTSERINANGSSIYELSMPIGLSHPIESSMIVRVDQTILKAPNNSYFTIKNNKKNYSIDARQTAPFSINVNDIVVIADNETLVPITDYTVDFKGITIKINAAVYKKYYGKQLIISVRNTMGYNYIPPTLTDAAKISFSEVYSSPQIIEIISSYQHDAFNIQRHTVTPYVDQEVRATLKFLKNSYLTYTLPTASSWAKIFAVNGYDFDIDTKANSRFKLILNYQNNEIETELVNYELFYNSNLYLEGFDNGIHDSLMYDHKIYDNIKEFQYGFDTELYSNSPIDETVNLDNLYQRQQITLDQYAKIVLPIGYDNVRMSNLTCTHEFNNQLIESVEGIDYIQDVTIDPYKFINIGYDTELYDNSIQLNSNNQEHYDHNSMFYGQIILDQTVLSQDHIWLTKNSQLLIPGIDYVLNDDRRSVRLKEPATLSDEFEIIIYAGDKNLKNTAYMQFKDMLNRVHYKRMSLNKQTILVNDLHVNDLTIEVADATMFDIPNPILNKPGIIEIVGERIEYFSIDGNTLGQLRRGTLGTGVRAVYFAGTTVQEIGYGSTMPYTDNSIIEQITYSGNQLIALPFKPNKIDTTKTWFADFGNTLKGVFSNVSSYSINDVVIYNNYYYKCVVNVTASNSMPNYAQLPNVTDFWQKYLSIPAAFGQSNDIEVFVGGYNYSLEWSPLTNFNVDDIITISNSTYQVSIAHKSGLTFKSDVDEIVDGILTGSSVNWSHAYRLFTGHIRLKKVPFLVHDKNASPNYSVGNYVLEPEFSVDGVTNNLRLTSPLPIGTQITVIKKSGMLWQTVNQNTDFLNGVTGSYYVVPPKIPVE